MEKFTEAFIVWAATHQTESVIILTVAAVVLFGVFVSLYKPERS